MRVGWRRSALIVLAVPLCLGAQDASFRTNVYTVEVTIAAENSKGRIPADLKRDDFRVWDNSKEQTVASLDFLRHDKTAPAPLPPNTYENRFGGSERPQIVSIILLDAVNTQIENQPAIRRKVADILAQIAPDEKVAVFTLGSTLRTLHEFTTDRASLLGKIARYRGEVSIYGGVEDGVFEDNEFTPEWLAVRKAQETVTFTLAALEQIANYVKGIPGRKNLLWVSAAFPLALGVPNSGASSQYDTSRFTAAPIAGKYYQNFQKEMDRTVRALNTSNVVVYPIDSRGLSANPRAPINQRTMTMLADETGGKAFYDRNDIDRFVRQALDDTREVYLLNYAPRDLVRDGAYHQIRIQTTRPGLRLRYRRGYYAPNAIEPEDAARGKLERALSSPLDETAVGIRATLNRPDPMSDQVQLLLYLKSSDLSLAPAQDRWTGEVQVEVVQTTTTGHTLGGVRQTAALALSQDAYTRAVAEGLRLQIPITKDAQANGLRIAVLDKASGRIGSLSVPLPAR